MCETIRHFAENSRKSITSVLKFFNFFSIPTIKKYPFCLIPWPFVSQYQNNIGTIKTKTLKSKKNQKKENPSVRSEIFLFVSNKVEKKKNYIEKKREKSKIVDIAIKSYSIANLRKYLQHK